MLICKMLYVRLIIFELDLADFSNQRGKTYKSKNQDSQFWRYIYKI